MISPDNSHPVSPESQKTSKNAFLKRGAAFLAVAALFFLLGRYTVPTKVEYKETTKTEWKERVEFVDRVVEKKVYVRQKDTQKDVQKDVQKDKKVTTKVVIAPDGTKTIEKVEETKVADKTAESTKVAEREVATSEKTQDTTMTKVAEGKTETKIERTESRGGSDWHAGATVRLPLSFDQIPAPAYGFLLERKIFGGVWLGVSADTMPTVGVSMSVDW